MNKYINYAAKALHFAAAIMLGALFIGLYILFGSEFLLFARLKGLFLLFAVLIIYNGVYFLLPIQERLSLSLVSFKGKAQKAISIMLHAWNALLGIALLIGYFILLGTVMGIFDQLAIILAIVAAVPAFGFAALFIFDSAVFFIGLIKTGSAAFSIKRGMLSAGVMFLVFTIAAGIGMASYSPEWNLGVGHTALFSAGEEEGREYRIPSLMVLPDGQTVLAFCESRANGFDDGGDINLVMKRSTDGGLTWGVIVTIADDGDNTVGNPCPVYDSATGKIIMLYCINNHTVFVMSSPDLGLTWSESQEITDTLDLYDESAADAKLKYGTGPGVGIELKYSDEYAGRLIVPGYYFAGRGTHALYSDDHGATWHRGENITETSSEPQVYETTDGILHMNARNNAGGGRYVAESSDGGKTFNSAVQDMELPDPGCMGSVLRFDGSAAAVNDIILFTNPDRNSRSRLSIKVSANGGSDWEEVMTVYSGPSAYSCLGVLIDGTVLVLFEQGEYDYRESIQLARISADKLGL